MKALSPFDPWHSLTTGQSGSGKTTFTVDRLKRRPADYRFIFDHQSKLAKMLGKEPVYDLSLVPLAMLGGWCVFDPVRQFPGEFEKAFDLFCECCFYASQKLPGYKLFFMDELGDYCTKVSAPKPIRMIITSGRNWGLHCVAITRDISDIPKALRAQFTEIITFYQSEPGILDGLQERGFNREAVQTLKQFEFICREPQTGREFKGSSRR